MEMESLFYTPDFAGISTRDANGLTQLLDIGFKPSIYGLEAVWVKQTELLDV